MRRPRARSGSSTLAPTMRLLGLAAVVALVVAGVAAERWLSSDWLRTDLERAVRRVRERSDADGLELVRMGPPHVAAASPGERVRAALDAGSAREIAVAAVCDADCDDLALRLYGPDGAELARDAAGDAVPVVSATLDRPGAVELEVSMHGCRARQCGYAWQLLRAEPREAQSDAGGSGTCFAVGPSGLVLTARHVVADAREIDVRFAGGDARPARVEASDEASDLALLRVASTAPEYLSLSAPGSVRLGEPVFTIGFPAVDVLGDEPKYNDGTVSALSASGPGPPTLQLSIPVQPGSSGGPVVNDRGEVVGIVESVADASFFGDGSGLVPQSLSWAVKAETARELVPPAAPRSPAESRADAIARVLRAVCLVETR